MTMKTLIVPIGIVGCGKSSLARHLATLTPLTHIQNDDIPGNSQQKKKRYLELILSSISTSSLIFADKNHHLPQHRHQIFTTLIQHRSPCRVIVLDWRVDRYDPVVLHAMSKANVQKRGESHQTLSATNPMLDVIIDAFIKDYVPFCVDESVGRDCVVVEMAFDDCVVNAERVMQALQNEK